MGILSLISSLLKLVKMVYWVIKKIFVFTGVWIPILVLVIANNGRAFFKSNFILGLFIDLVFIVSFLVFIYITSQNVLRIFLKDSELNLIELIKNRNGNKIIDPVIKEMQTEDLKGFIFGKKENKYINMSESEDGHILVIGGAGSGKSSCIAIPSLLSWKDRVFAIDIKGELYEKTSKARKKTKVFNPDDINSYGYDPFYILKNSENKVQEAKDIAMTLCPLPQDIKDPFWINSAQNLLTGAILLYSDNDFSFVETMQEIQKTPVDKLVEIILKSDNQDAKFFINQFSSVDIKLLSGIFAELSNHIMLFATNKQVIETLSREKTITPEDIENGFDIYINIKENKLNQYKTLLTLICTQFLKHCENREENEANEPILILLDEFARIGKLEPILDGLATLRSKKVHICILTQSLAQLDAIYGKAQRQIIADNCNYKAILKATDTDTQEYFSKLVGTYDKEKKTSSSNFEQYTKLGTGTGTSKTTEEKRIIKPEDFAYLEDIILLSPKGFMRVDKTPYYKELDFNSKV